jgi:hypothetical protein
MLASPTLNPAAQYGKARNAVIQQVLKQRNRHTMQLGQAVPAGATPGLASARSAGRRLPMPKLTQGAGRFGRATLNLPGVIGAFGVEGSPGDNEFSSSAGIPVAEYFRGLLSGGPQGDAQGIPAIGGGSLGLGAPTGSPASAPSGGMGAPSASPSPSSAPGIPTMAPQTATATPLGGGGSFGNASGIAAAASPGLNAALNGSAPVLPVDFTKAGNNNPYTGDSQYYPGANTDPHVASNAAQARGGMGSYQDIGLIPLGNGLYYNPATGAIG